MKKSLLALFMSLAMIISLTACGGGGSSEAPAEAAEPNAGIAGIVFTVPDGWTVSDVGMNYISYKNPDSSYELFVNTMTQEDIAGMEGEDASLSVQEYYEKYFVPDDKNAKKYNYKYEAIKACDSDGYLTKYTGDAKGIHSMSADWIYDGTLYSIGYSCNANYDNNGKVKDDAVFVSSDEEKAFEAIVASVKPGDGNSFKSAGFSNTVGSYTYEMPEGFTIESAANEFVTATKNDSDVTLNMNLMDEKAYAELEMDDKPATLEEYFAQSLEYGEKITIAGVDGVLNKSEEEDGRCFNVFASFMTDDGIYDISMDAGDVYDEEGYIKDGAVPLSDEDLAAFDSFIASIAKK